MRRGGGVCGEGKGVGEVVGGCVGGKGGGEREKKGVVVGWE